MWDVFSGLDWTLLDRDLNKVYILLGSILVKREGLRLGNSEKKEEE